MDPARRTQAIRLAVLCGVLALLVWFVLLPAIAPAGVVPPGPLPTAGGAPSGKAAGGPVEVRLGSLERAATEPAPAGGGRRNPVRMGGAAPALVS